MATMELLEGVKYGGQFFVDGRERSGELTLKGEETDLYIHEREPFQPSAIEDHCIHGVLNDRSRVSLLQCDAMPVSGSAHAYGESYSFTNIFPHFVLHGYRHITAKERLVRSIHFVPDDATTIFYDFDAFSHVLKPERHIQALVKSKMDRTGREIAIGEGPHIAYFTGKYQIFQADTVLSTISATHNPFFNWGGPEGVWIKNSISVDIRFPEPVDFDAALDAVMTMLTFLGLIAGRRQVVKSIYLLLADECRQPPRLNLHWSFAPKRKREIDGRKPQPSDLPLNGGMDPETFGSVLTAWLGRQGTWQEARARFSNSFSQQNSFSTDRLIASANMFDLLPSSAVPRHSPAGPELREARDQAKAIFKGLSPSPERDGVLGALGRVGKASLRDKIEYRAQYVLASHGAKLPNLLGLLRLAVDCRNYYVHGSSPKADYSRYFSETVIFFTQSLEFVFAASDLIEAGWDLSGFAQKGTTMSHPFGTYLIGYSELMDCLNMVLPENVRLK
jgi:hypothetical protein